MALRSAGSSLSWLQARLSRTKFTRRAKLVGMAVSWLLDTSCRLKQREGDEKCFRCLKHPRSAASAKLISGRAVKLDGWQLAQVWEKKQLPQDWQIIGDFSFPKICQTKNKLKTNPTMRQLTSEQSLEYLPSSATESRGIFSQQWEKGINPFQTKK